MPNRRKAVESIKVFEEAKLTVDMIRTHYKPHMQLQEIYSEAIHEYMQKHYPELEEAIEAVLKRRIEERTKN